MCGFFLVHSARWLTPPAAFGVPGKSRRAQQLATRICGVTGTCVVRAVASLLMPDWFGVMCIIRSSCFSGPAARRTSCACAAERTCRQGWTWRPECLRQRCGSSVKLRCIAVQRRGQVFCDLPFPSRFCAPVVDGRGGSSEPVCHGKFRVVELCHMSSTCAGQFVLCVVRMNPCSAASTCVAARGKREMCV
mmetsp:Transcript_75316/g.201182  ORF Transcript_75316/g.201182 Transcript_75316/m.201182 type:complete len:191 (+) Transcript_75316:1898-2470(+)